MIEQIECSIDFDDHADNHKGIIVQIKEKVMEVDQFKKEEIAKLQNNVDYQKRELEKEEENI